MMKGIDHIIYIMLENRSFDSVLGWLYENDQPKNFIPKPPPNSPPPPPYNGLQTGNYYNVDSHGTKHHAKKIGVKDGQQIPCTDPNEDFKSVQDQIANNMGGFFKDFEKTKDPNPQEIMAAYTPESLPVLNSLAKNFAVSDAYFSSVPTQTDSNRAFSITGNSIGAGTAMVNNTETILPAIFTEPTIWDVISNSNKNITPDDWTIFYSQKWPGVPAYPGSYCFTKDLFYSTLKKYQPYDSEGRYGYFQTINEFNNKLAGIGTSKLPKFSYIEPNWCIDYDGINYYNGNDYHPPANVACGEVFLHDLYDHLKSSKYWKNTLLIINFDEHGGTYDHVEPPSSGVNAPWEDTNNGTKYPSGFDIQFDYKSLGVRVPLILISSLIEENTVIRPKKTDPISYFDHTSVIATILNHFGIPKEEWGLGSRTYNAATFEDVITLSTARETFEIAKPLSNTCKTTKPVQSICKESSDLPKRMMKRALARIAKQQGHTEQTYKTLYEQHFNTEDSISDIKDKAEAFLKKINNT